MHWSRRNFLGLGGLLAVVIPSLKNSSKNTPQLGWTDGVNRPPFPTMHGVLKEDLVGGNSSTSKLPITYAAMISITAPVPTHTYAYCLVENLPEGYKFSKGTKVTFMETVYGNRIISADQCPIPIKA